jgi:hypothetical protein
MSRPAATAPWTGPPLPLSWNPSGTTNNPHQVTPLTANSANSPLACPQPEGNRNAACTGPPTAPWTPTPPPTSAHWPLAARQAGLGEPEITRTLDSARKTRQPHPDRQAEEVN